MDREVSLYNTYGTNYEVELCYSKGEGMIIYEFSRDSVNMCDSVSLPREEAIAIARAILAHYGEAST